MKRRIASLISAALFLGLLSSGVVQAALSTLYIRDDATGGDCNAIGTWDAASKTCTLAQDINASIEIDGSGIVLDGNGHAITGSNTGDGIYLPPQARSTTIKNLSISGFTDGIRGDSAYYHTITGNTISNNTNAGMAIDGGGNNLSGNTVKDNGGAGIGVLGDCLNSITGNTVLNNEYGIGAGICYLGNTVSGNTVSGNRSSGYYESAGPNPSSIYQNTFRNNGIGISIYGQAGGIYNNTISDNTLGIYLEYGKNVIVMQNTITDNSERGIYLNSTSDSVVDGNQFSGNPYGIYLESSTHNSVVEDVVDSSTIAAIWLNNASNSNVMHDNTLRNGAYGIALDGSSSNLLVFNTIAANFKYGLYLNSADNNQIYQNNLIDNYVQAYVSGSNGNAFAVDGGNYWSDYDTPAEGCNDANRDGFCDAPYTFNGGQDDLPWTRQDGWLYPALGDTTPPTTTDNAPAGWQKADFSIALTCSDDQGGSGCRQTHFQIDGGAWQTGNSIGISTEGDHLVEYFSVDIAGNAESNKRIHAKLDKTPPAVSILSPELGTYVHTATVLVRWTAKDTLSGLTQVVGTFDGAVLKSGRTIDLFYLKLGSHVVAVEATDNAGNTTTASATFQINANLNSLIAANKRACSLHWINKEQMCISLTAKLRAAASALENHDVETARKQLGAYINQLEAQRGKAVNQKAYDLLKADARYVLDHLP